MRLRRTARKALRQLPRREHARVLRGVLSLEEDPLPDGYKRKKLGGYDPPAYRLRSGPWRVIYRIEGQTVEVADVVARKDLERWVREHPNL